MSSRQRRETAASRRAVHEAPRGGRGGRGRRPELRGDGGNRPVITRCKPPAGHVGAGGMREAWDGIGSGHVRQEAVRSSSVLQSTAMESKKHGASVARSHHHSPVLYCVISDFYCPPHASPTTRSKLSPKMLSSVAAGMWKMLTSSGHSKAASDNRSGDTNFGPRRRGDRVPCWRAPGAGRRGAWADL